VLTQALLKPSVEEPSIWLALMSHPIIMHKGSNTATIAMMITIAIDTLRMSAGAYTDSFRLQQLRRSHNNYRAAATRTEAFGAHQYDAQLVGANVGALSELAGGPGPTARRRM
jgi:hypothetical protein